MKTLIHKLTQEKEAKIVLHTAKHYQHLIIFDRKKGHYQVIRKLLKHFIINDTTTKAGWLINGKPDFYANSRVDWRIEIAKNKRYK